MDKPRWPGLGQAKVFIGLLFQPTALLIVMGVLP